jgi:hypothetical protein
MFNRPVASVLLAGVLLSGAAPASAQFNLLGMNTSQDPSILVCASVDSRTVRCPIPVDNTAAFSRQISQAPCTKGTSYVIDASAISVSQGCRAEFKLTSTKSTSQSTSPYSQTSKSAITRLPEPGVAMDEQSRLALTEAIITEMKKDSRVHSVQVTVNSRYGERFESQRDVRFAGKYGASINDGDWVTRAYEAKMYLPRDQVTELKLGSMLSY